MHPCADGAVVQYIIFYGQFFLLVANIITEATCVFYRPYEKNFF